jgi:hypothetical protein
MANNPLNVLSEKLVLYSGQEYFNRLPSRLAEVQSGGRIAIMNMAFMPNEPHRSSYLKTWVRQLIVEYQ